MATERYGTRWSREETILAFSLYCRMPFAKVSKDDSRVIALAELIGRTPSSVGLKIGNLGNCDPNLAALDITGLKHISKLDKQIAEEFLNDWERLSYEAAKIEAEYRSKPIESVIEEDFALPEGRSEARAVSVRANQSFFRAAVLGAYGKRCCITGLQLPEVLVASHIKPWSVSDPKTERTDPRNGLCLNALHDKAFDRGLISVSPDYRVLVSRRLLDSELGEMKQLFSNRNKSIILPSRFHPKKEYLEYHNDTVFLDRCSAASICNATSVASEETASEEKPLENMFSCPAPTAGLFDELRALVLACGGEQTEERLWARLPSFYVGGRFVRLIPFADHINIEASAISAHAAELSGFRLTPKGMLQLYPGAPVPTAELERIFRETLHV